MIVDRVTRHFATPELGLPDVPVGAHGLHVGADVVCVALVAESIRRFGDRYLERVFSPAELADCTSSLDPAPRLAARFAAKEATLKALRAAEVGIDWRSIEVRRQRDGAPRLRLSGRAQSVARRLHLSRFSVSLSHDGDYAFAVVIATRRKTPQRRKPR
jgi:holo-[acyl-carrier protein] synthase